MAKPRRRGQISNVTTVVHSQHLVTILGSGHVIAEDIDEILTIAPILVAADGGADAALAAGHVPDAVIGDFDSVSPNALAQVPKASQFRIAEQNSTDFEKCLSRIEAPLVLALGVTGRRIDHTLAVFSVLMRVPSPRCIVVGEDDIVFAAPERMSMNLPLGSRFSLFPMASVRGKSNGLRWPIAGINFMPTGRIGTSNEVSGPVELTFDGPGMLVILPRDALEEAIGVLQARA